MGAACSILASRADSARSTAVHADGTILQCKHSEGHLDVQGTLLFLGLLLLLWVPLLIFSSGNPTYQASPLLHCDVMSLQISLREQCSVQQHL